MQASISSYTVSQILLEPMWNATLRNVMCFPHVYVPHSIWLKLLTIYSILPLTKFAHYLLGVQWLPNLRAGYGSGLALSSQLTDHPPLSLCNAPVRPAGSEIGWTLQKRLRKKLSVLRKQLAPWIKHWRKMGDWQNVSEGCCRHFWGCNKSRGNERASAFENVESSELA